MGVVPTCLQAHPGSEKAKNLQNDHDDYDYADDVKNVSSHDVCYLHKVRPATRLWMAQRTGDQLNAGSFLVRMQCGEQ